MSDEDLFEVSDRLLGRFDFAAELAAVEDNHREQKRRLLTSIIEVMDSFDRLFITIEDSFNSMSDPERQRFNSIQLIARQLERLLQNAGVTYIPALNVPFDSDKHFIVDVKEISGVPADTIVQEVLKGYEWEGEILRIPHVIIAGNPAPTVEEE
jgi:molecular chaperone GrpE (heat shock protein)